MVAFVSANRPERLRTQDSIDGTVIVPSASKTALYLYNQPHIAVSVVVVTVVVVRVVRIRIRIEEGKPNASMKTNVRWWTLGTWRGVGRVMADRVIIGEVALAAEAAVVVKLSAATQANKTSFVFMIFDLSNHWTPRRRQELLVETHARVTRSLP